MFAGLHHSLLPYCVSWCMLYPKWPSMLPRLRFMPAAAMCAHNCLHDHLVVPAPCSPPGTFGPACLNCLKGSYCLVRVNTPIMQQLLCVPYNGVTCSVPGPELPEAVSDTSHMYEVSLPLCVLCAQPHSVSDSLDCRDCFVGDCAGRARPHLKSRSPCAYHQVPHPHDQ